MRPALLLCLLSVAAAAEPAAVEESAAVQRPAGLAESASVQKPARFEVVLTPGIAQVNGAFTQHFGFGGELIWYPHERFGVKVFGQYNWLARTSQLNNDLVNITRYEQPSTEKMLLTGAVLAGAEAIPFEGGVLARETALRFGVLLDAGLGVGFTRYELKPANDTGPATFGDTGARFTAAIGAAARVRFGEHVALRIGVRDLVYSSNVGSVNGCTRDDLGKLDANLRGVDVGLASTGCHTETFDGVSEGGRKRSDDVPLAFAASKQPTGLAHNVTAHFGLSFLF